MTKLLAWARGHRPQAALGAGAVGAVGVGLWRRHRKAAAGTVPTDATTASVAPASSDTAGGVGYDPAAFNDAASMYLPQISQQLTGLTAAITSTSASAPKPKAKAVAKHLSPHERHIAAEKHREHLQHIGAA